MTSTVSIHWWLLEYWMSLHMDSLLSATDWQGCHDAVMDFRKQNMILSPLVPVYHDFSLSEEKRGAWWQKV
jgi:hypothetical protein